MATATTQTTPWAPPRTELRSYCRPPGLGPRSAATGGGAVAARRGRRGARTPPATSLPGPSLLRFDVRQRHEGVAGHQERVALHPVRGVVDPAPVGLLVRAQGLRDV